MSIAVFLLPDISENVGRGTDEDDAVLLAGPSKIGVLAEEAVAGVDRVGAGELRDTDHLVDVQVRANRVIDLTDLVGLVCLLAVLGEAILEGEDRDGLCPMLERGTERPNRDLGSVGNEDLRKHWLPFDCWLYLASFPRARRRLQTQDVWAQTPRRAEDRLRVGVHRRCSGRP